MIQLKLLEGIIMIIMTWCESQATKTLANCLPWSGHYTLDRCNAASRPGSPPAGRPPAGQGAAAIAAQAATATVTIILHITIISFDVQ